MRALLAGALLGLLVALFPSLLVTASGIVLPVLAKAATVSLLVALAARPVLPRIRRWAR